jgi:alkylation response protein AidB-like acyl-CoA dehydrogenase
MVDRFDTIANNLQFKPSVETTSEILIRKTIATQAIIRTAGKALELAGGTGYLRSFGLERLLRDAYGGQFHPLMPKKQHLFTGRVSMGLDVDLSAPNDDSR